MPDSLSPAEKPICVGSLFRTQKHAALHYVDKETIGGDDVTMSDKPIRCSAEPDWLLSVQLSELGSTPVLRLLAGCLDVYYTPGTGAGTTSPAETRPQLGLTSPFPSSRRSLLAATVGQAI
ncbi:hypothetical protein chiPu_0016189 [Chiloscyllium punctatum]|uniref:Uncharacterized protein n=1 Tax=Chiloscyllium punctatum TaxID=137246 RepID=A0A401T508_CHIPU|nr:hypothetical protein [Chiloscyllium punctatum]